MADATVRGAVSNASTTGSATVTPTGIVTGDWVIVEVMDTMGTSTTPGTNQPTPATPPSGDGWVVLEQRVKTGTRSTTVFAKRRVDGENTYTFSFASTNAWVAVCAYGPGGVVNPANWQLGTAAINTAAATTQTAPTMTPNVKSLVLAIFAFASSTSGQTDANNTLASPYTKDIWSTQWTTTIANSGLIGHQTVAANTAAGAATWTHSAASSANNYSRLIAIPTVADAVAPSLTVTVPADGAKVSTPRPVFTGTASAGSAVGLGKSDGTSLGTATAASDGSWSITPTADLVIGSATYKVTATLNGLSTSVSGTVTYTAPPTLNWWTGTAIEKRLAYWWDGTQLRNIGTPVMLHRGRKVDEFFTGTRPPVVAHRCGSADFYEHSLMGATRCLVAGVAALEISVAVTSDGVFLGAHDATADRTTPAVSGFTFSAHTWSEVQALTQTVPTGTDPVYGAAAAAPPYYKLTDFLNAYAESHTIFIDPKVLTASQRQTLYALLKTYPNYQNTFVGKYYHTGTNIADEFHAFGCKVWGYAYQADVDGTGATQLGTTVTKWDWLGMDYNANADAWTTTLSYNRPVLVHITPTYAAALTGLNRGAAGVMASGVNEVMRGFTA